jgi:hypothetical protein
MVCLCCGAFFVLNLQRSGAAVYLRRSLELRDRSNMPTRVLLYTLQDENATSKYEGSMGCYEGDMFADLRVRLEAAQVVEWPFQFWDSAG